MSADDQTFLIYTISVRRYIKAEYPDISDRMESGTFASPPMLHAVGRMVSDIVLYSFHNGASINDCAGSCVACIKDGLTN